MTDVNCPKWRCGIADCGHLFETADRLLFHQIHDHNWTTCRICGETQPEGFFAIKHVIDEHNRAEYARQYTADAREIRWRESIKSEIEGMIDLDQFPMANETPVGRDRSGDGLAEGEKGVGVPSG